VLVCANRSRLIDIAPGKIGARPRFKARIGDFAVRKFAPATKRNPQSGYGLVFAAFGLVVLLGAAGLSVDIGYLRYQRRLMQSATDSAALAGAAQLGAGASALQAGTAATDDSGLNGFPSSAGITVTPTQTTLNGNTNTMQVTISKSYQTFFMRVFGGSFQNVTVSTTATAQYLGSRNCIYALKGGGGINVTGAVTLDNCGIIDNQSLTGGGSIQAASVGVHGASITTNPPAITGMLQSSDPLSYLTAPAAPGGLCTTISYTNADNKFGAQTLGPGKYCGISFSAAYSQNVTFAAGTYYITGPGGLSFQGSGHVTGTGVFFYMNGGAINFTNSQHINLTAPTGGVRPGILFFQPATNTATATINGSNGGAGSRMQGALYFPNATLTMAGAGKNSAYIILVAKTLNLNTAITSTSNFASLPNGSPIRTTTLVE
jgi:Flp pilus assembly protein TadG